MKYENEWKRRVVLIGCLLCVFVSAGYSVEANEPNVKAELDRRVKLWGTYCGKKLLLSDYTGNEYYRDIVAMGIPALPYIMEKVQEGSWALGDGVMKIMKKRFEEYEQNEYPVRDSRSTASALAKWWPNAGRDTAEKFKRLYAERKAFLKEGKKKEAEERLGFIRSLGIGGLPYLMEKIGAGDAELIGVVSWLTDGKVEKDAKAKDVLGWWRENGQDWLVPFPDARPTADIPKRGSVLPYIIWGVATLVIIVAIVLLKNGLRHLMLRRYL